MNFRGIIFIYAAIVAAVLGCSWFQNQPTAPSDAPPIQIEDDKLMAACVITCMAFEFTTCGQTMQRSLPIGQILEATQDVVETVTETVENLSAAQADCTAKCITLADSLAHMDTPDELPFECLADAEDCEAVDGCFEWR